MTQYIDKDALVAELKKRFDYRVNGLKAINKGTFRDENQSEDEFNAVLTRCAYNAAKNEVFELMCFLDTLEVKEVDLDFQMFAKEMDAVFALPSSETINTEEEPLNWEYAIAKHFFELGLNTQHSSINIPNIDDILEESGIDPYSKEAKIFKESYYIALEKFKAQKGEEL